MTDASASRTSDGDDASSRRPDTGAPFPRHWSADVLASDGGTVHLRPISPSDGDRVVAFHSGLSERTRYMRWFGPYPEMSARDVAHMTGVDHHDRVALVAVLGGRIIAVGIYESLAASGRPEAAEVAFVVADDHQGRGLGTVLLEHLAGAAAENGFTLFEAEVLAENRAMLSVFRDAGYQLSRSFDGSTVHVEFAIDPTDALLAVRNARELGSEARSVANLLRPDSVAIIGASTDPGKVGNALLANVIAGGFRGPVFPVNAEARAVRGIRSYPSVRDIPDPVDLAIVAVPAENVGDVLQDCLAKNVKTMVVVSAGFAESGAAGALAQRTLVHEIRAHGMRLVGPNALGVINTDPEIALNATLAPRVPGRGRVGFFCQSGALGIAILDTAARRQLGLSTFVSAGNRADLSGNDLLQYWDADDATDVILLYLESFGNPRKFSRLARRVSRNKPIIAVKAGRTAVAPSQIRSDSGIDDESARAVLEQSGVIQVDTIADLFDCATVLAHQPLPTGPRVAVVGNSTVLGVLAASAGEPFGLTVVAQTDLGPGAGVDEFGAAVRAATGDEGVDAVIAVFVPPVAVGAEAYARALVAATRDCGKTVVSTFLGVEGIPDALTVHDEDGVTGRGSVPSYPGPERAAAAVGRAWRYARWRARPESDVERPDGLDVDRARALVAAEWGASVGHGDDTRVLDEVTSAELLRCYGIEVAPFRTVTSADEAVAAADELGYPVVVKAVTAAWRGRLDGEGARLDLPGPDAVRAAFHDLSQLTGERSLHVQQMAPRGVPVVIRVRDDASLGSLISFGLAGPTFELLGDHAHRAVPLTAVDADELLIAPRAAPLLTGFRGQLAADRPAIRGLLVRVSALADDLPEVRELALDPVLAAHDGATVLSGRIRLGPVPSRTDTGPRRLS
ncbi:bifunctional GNAT family N-acetyltransferase/acetate--CoA ligase family protein [uncultured Williamsia sp.]|uniref:bifunctional acetate--CoA ligase family protein/GNAT family N-acetyltransferase n=1 Tax=uncultured Williamsia sp. TaxID=259311 RepID=UPI0026138CA5|nr:bifunctional GNAT family N-acetyltransferase/acetate--CoA ligase family protein [uncultured Williamsia sp.]